MFIYIIYHCAGIRKSKAGRDEAKVKAALAKLTASAALSADEGNNDKVWYIRDIINGNV